MHCEALGDQTKGVSHRVSIYNNLRRYQLLFDIGCTELVFKVIHNLKLYRTMEDDINGCGITFLSVYI